MLSPLNFGVKDVETELPDAALALPFDRREVENVKKSTEYKLDQPLPRLEIIESS